MNVRFNMLIAESRPSATGPPKSWLLGALLRLSTIMGPEADSSTATTEHLFDHLVGLRKKQCRNGGAKRVCGLWVDDKLIFVRLLDRQIARSRPPQDAIGVGDALARADGRLTV